MDEGRRAELFFIGSGQTEPVQGQRNPILIKTKEECLNISGTERRRRRPTRPPLSLLMMAGRREE